MGRTHPGAPCVPSVLSIPTSLPSASKSSTTPGAASRESALGLSARSMQSESVSG